MYKIIDLKGKLAAFLCLTLLLTSCITPDNEVIEGLGTPDLACGPIPDVIDGAEYQPRTDPVPLAVDGQKHPDIFYIAWSKLDERSDLRFPEAGYDDGRYEDRLLVSRKQADGGTKTWQLLPPTDNNCQDLEKHRIHSFDVAPNGRSLYVSMARTPNSGGGDSHLGIYRFDLETFDLTKISKDDDTHFMYPTYVGNDPDTRHEMLVIAKTVTEDEFPNNYAQRSVLLDEYDRAPTPLIHKMDAHTGATTRIGFNNSHQTEPFVMVGPDNNRIVVFTQWEHQDTVNRFALWKTQIDGSDNFTFFGQESSFDKSGTNLFQARVVRSGPYKDHILMTEGHHKFDAEGHLAITFRHHQELRSAKNYLQEVQGVGSTNTHLSRNPEHYNDESFVYSYRNDSNYTYQIRVKQYPDTLTSNPSSSDIGEQLSPSSDSFHFVQARSFYPPERELIAPTDATDLGENRVSFTNNHLNGKSGFLVQDLTESDNGVQHQLDGISPDDLSMQFFIPSHHFGDSHTISLKNSPEMSIPASDFIKPEADGSFGVVMKNGLYVWKVNKRFNHGGQEGPGGNDGADIWVPVRSERQEVSFVPNRVNACNQCHQERDEANLHLYTNLSDTIAETKMRGNLQDVVDISDYNASYNVPDFHRDIMPLLSDPQYKGPTGKTCAECHTAGTKLDLSNKTGPSSMNSAYRALVKGAHKLPSGDIVPYSNDSINPLGMDDNYHPAPLLWSLLLNNDLAPENGGDSNRSISAVGDYGATYNQEVSDAIARINGEYDHSQHWPADIIQKFIIYSSTQMPAGLSDRITFTAEGADDAWRKSPAGQKAYQAMVRSCFNCHNSFTGGNNEGIEDPLFGLPEDKRFSISTGLRDIRMRFMVHNHVAEKDDTAYSQLLWQSNLTQAMYNTLQSATFQINYDNPAESSLLKHALGLSASDDKGSGIPRDVNHAAVLSESDEDYQAIHDWVTGEATNWAGITNQAPTIDTPVSGEIVLKEYDPPRLDFSMSWSDPDGASPSTSHDGANSGKEYSQVYIAGDSSRHSMLAMEYRTFNTADLEAYAILGDAQKTSVDFIATDGQQTSTPLTVPVTVTTDYHVPAPDSTFPESYAFYTTRIIDGSATPGGELHKLSSSGADELIGTINGYSNDWSTMYRRADRGWLYFLNQNAQTVHVVDETTAEQLFTINIDLSNAVETPNHKQTVYLLWWRPNNGDDMDHLGNENCPHGELQALMESKLSLTKDGDFYIGLGCGEMVDASSATEASAHNNVIAPGEARFDELQQAGHSYRYEHPSTYRTKLVNGGNTLAVYTWRRATFMSRWVNEGVDELNVLNLVTGKDKELGDFSFPAKTHDGLSYPAGTYNNVRAIVVAEDGAFYGFNKDANTAPVEMFNFDPVNEIQTPVTTPGWLQDYFNNYPLYGTPFLVIEPRQP